MQQSCRVLLLLMLFASPVIAQTKNYPPEFGDARAESYKTIEDVELKLWVFDPPELQPGDKRPAIVFFFGGGWRSGTPTQFEQHCRYLAQQGMVAITADYRVRQRQGTLADQCVADAKSAIRWVRQNAQRLGVDPDRIVAAGGSAGGHLAACTGVVPGFDEPNEDASVSSVPNAMALFNPALVLAAYDGLVTDDDKLADIATRTGVPPAEISPIHHVRRGLPPTIIFHGEADPTVSFATAARYTEVASEAGNRCELAGYPGATHGFFNYGRNGTPGEHYLLTVDRLHRFLQSLDYLSAPPSLLPESSNVHWRSHFDHSREAFDGKKSATVAFIGGSITEMNGYRVMVEQFLTTRFPETDFTFVNAGISSTCSTTGAFRLMRDVLSAAPDLLFVEFAVNDDQDAAHAARECRRGMEGVLRTARASDPTLDVVVTHFVNPPMLERLQRGETPISSGSHEAVARHYGVSTVDLASEVAKRIQEGTLTWKEYGGTHPAPAGNRIAADMIDDLLTVAWSSSNADASTKTRGGHRMPKPLDAKSYANGRLIDVSDAEADSQWIVGRPDWASISGSKRSRFDQEQLLWCQEPGAELKLRFKGSAVGMYVLAGPDAGTVEYSIDGSPMRNLDLYHRFSKGLHYPRTVMLDADLEAGPHELTLRVSDQRNPNSNGNAVRILEFVAN